MIHATYRAFLALLGLLIAAAGDAGSAAPANTPTIRMSTDIARCDASNVVLKATITNTGASAIAVGENVLPWGDGDTLVLVAVTNDVEGRVLKRLSDLGHVAPDVIRIVPSADISGTIDLVREFPDLVDTLRTREVLVFWSYQLETVDEITSQRVSGSLGLRLAKAGTKAKCETF